MQARKGIVTGEENQQSTFLTSSPYKIDLETSIKKKIEVEELKKKNSISKLLNETKNKERTKKKTEDKRKCDSKKKQTKKAIRKKIKTVKKQIAPLSSEESNFSVNDDTDESPDRSERQDAKCFYCNGLFSEDVNWKSGEQWIQCPPCRRWVHAQCAGVDDDGRIYSCEFCSGVYK